jgi:chromosome segregation ATPase
MHVHTRTGMYPQRKHEMERDTASKDTPHRRDTKLIHTSRANRKAKQNEIKSKQAAVTKASKQLQDGRDELERMKDKEGALRAEINAARSKLEESKAACKASASQSTALRAVMDLAKKVDGIYGTYMDFFSLPFVVILHGFVCWCGLCA